MKSILKSKPKVKDELKTIVAGIVIGIIGFMAISVISLRLHSIENDPRFYESQKMTEMSGIQISQK